MIWKVSDWWKAVDAAKNTVAVSATTAKEDIDKQAQDATQNIDRSSEAAVAASTQAAAKAERAGETTACNLLAEGTSVSKDAAGGTHSCLRETNDQSVATGVRGRSAELVVPLVWTRIIVAETRIVFVSKRDENSAQLAIKVGARKRVEALRVLVYGLSEDGGLALRRGGTGTDIAAPENDYIF